MTDERAPTFKGQEGQPFAYPARLIIPRSPNELKVGAVVTAIDHLGASLRLESGHLPPGQLEGASVRLTLTLPAGELELVGLVRKASRQAGQMTLNLAFQNIHLEQVEAIAALKLTPRKDQRLLWDLWDQLKEGAPVQ